MSSQIIDVLVVGAGPVGLVSAILLAQSGLKVRLVEKGVDRCPYSRAFGVSARTMELLGLIGVAGPYIKQGRTPSKVRHRFATSDIVWHLEGTVKGCLHPTIILSQDEQERLLEHHLNQVAGVEIERGLELVNLFQTEALVAARLRDVSTGSEQTVEARYLIGSDGGRSTVRHLLEIPFDGTIGNGVVWLADAKESPRRNDELDDIVGEIHHNTKGRLLRFKFGEDICRYICFMPNLREPVTPTWEEFKAEAERRSFDPLTLVDPTWITALRFNYRVAGKYSKGRVFLAGDAAHVHSPVGGQGMNLGVQDAFNLCWRLIGVLKGIYLPQILGGYEQERRPIALETVKKVYRGTNFVFRANILHGIAIRGISFLACRFEKFRTRMIRSLLQLDLEYTTGRQDWRGVETMQVVTSDSGPGARCPNIKLFTEAGESCLHDLIHPELFTLIYFDGVAQEKQDDDTWDQITTKISDPKLSMIRVCFTTAKTVTSPNVVRTQDCTLSRSLFVRADSNAVYLVRPDAVVAYRMRPVHLLRLAGIVQSLSSLTMLTS